MRRKLPRLNQGDHAAWNAVVVQKNFAGEVLRPPRDDIPYLFSLQC